MRTVIKAFVVGVVGGLLLVGTAYAHSRYVRSEPGAEAIVATPPARVDIWFSQELFRRKGENTIQVTGPDGTEVSVGDTAIDDDDRTHIWVSLKPNLPAGVYQVVWKNVSLEDGHSFEGSFSFTIDPKALVTSTPMGTPTPIGKVASASTATEVVPAQTRPPAPTPETTSAAPGLAVTTVASPAPAPASTPAASGPCGLGTAPVIGLAGYVIIQRSRRKRSSR
jgi:methionine-rich copper-binding protein CopC